MPTVKAISNRISGARSPFSSAATGPVTGHQCGGWYKLVRATGRVQRAYGGAGGPGPMTVVDRRFTIFLLFSPAFRIVEPPLLDNYRLAGEFHVAKTEQIQFPHYPT